MTIKILSIEHLEVGMYITAYEQQDEHAAKLKQQGLVSKQATIDELKSLGIKEVCIDPSKGADSSFGMPVAAKQPPQKPETTVSLADERGRAEKIHSAAKDLIKNVMSDVKNGRPLDTLPVDEMAASMVQSLKRNQYALACLTRIREKDQYLLEHSVNVSILMGILARSMGFDDDTLHQLVSGALLHDIGKIRIADEILHKPGELKPEEWSEMKNHVYYGMEVLVAIEDISAIALAICGQHHEKLNGEGYPEGLTDRQITVYGKMAAIVDVYDAVTAHRCYHEAMPPPLAMKNLVKWSGDHLDRNLVYQFIRAMSIYPVGSLLELESGKLGVVVENNPAQPDKPVMNVFYNMKHRRYEPVEQIDLGKARCTEVIKRSIDPDKMNINIADFI